MWTWIDKEKNAALYVKNGEPSIFCGVNAEPLYSLLVNGLEPEPYIEKETKEDK
jgi:hypothetical protein